MTPGRCADESRDADSSAHPPAEPPEHASGHPRGHASGTAWGHTSGHASGQSAAPARALGALTLGLTLGTLLLARTSTRAPTRAAPAPEARQLYQAAAMLAASVLSDSALEHYRGQFENPGMFAPLASSALVLASALHAAGGPAAGLARPDPAAGGADLATSRAHRTRPDAHDPAKSPGRRAPRLRAGLPYAAACAVGLAGFGFHVYNVLRRPGGLSWGNLFYAAPLGAPAALSLAGLLGLAARRVEAGAPTLAHLPAGQALCALGAAGLAGTTLEAGLLHFRGAFQHPAMWLPVSLPPVGAALLARAALRPPARPRGLTRAWLDACTWLGLIGMGFHARGVARQMGGWGNWRQNLLSGPPLPAPPSFSALALAGRAALALRARDAPGVQLDRHRQGAIRRPA